MKTNLTPALFALLGFFAASPHTLAASKKADERTAALVVALQTVSPDPLGGRLGLAASASRTDSASSATTPTNRGLTAEMSRAVLDQRAYLIWKSAQKS
jgi:hypothetical protein